MSQTPAAERYDRFSSIMTRKAQLGILMCGALAACPSKTLDPNDQDPGTSSGGEMGPPLDVDPGASTTTSSSTSASTGSTGAPGGSSSSGVGMESCGFICSPDMGDAIPQCDPLAQDCPIGQKCVWYAEPGELRRRNAARCIDVVGDRAPFEPCSLPNGVWADITDDCGADSYCLNALEVTDHGFCAPYPKPGTIDCDHVPGTTYATENGSIFPHACLFYGCNPLAPATCPDGLRCTHYPSWLYGSLQCWPLPADELPVGAACDYEQCGPGKLCLPAEYVPGCGEQRCCTEWCDPVEPVCSDPAASCEVGVENIGACVVPGSLGG